MRIPVPAELLPADRLGRVHFVGIGGAALSGIARIMARRGVTVTGSDNNETPFLAPLRELGVPVTIGYDAGNVREADTLVVTTAAREDNPEVLEGRRRGLRVLPRSAGLASLMVDDDVLAVAGTHGKTTTTALLTVALLAAGADPTYAVGGVLRATGRNADAGAGRWFVAEADESDGAFLVYGPHAAIVTNVEADHLDQWGSEEAYRAAFVEFLDRVEEGGFVVLCVDDPGAAALAVPARDRGLEVVRVGTGDDVDYRATDLAFEGTRSRFAVHHGGRSLGTVELQIPGRHYVLDALAALALGLRLGYALDDLRAGLESFTGSGRRMEPRGEARGVRVFDSYAHMPQEIAADLAAARGVAGEGRVVVAFQPHLVSRTARYGVAMGEALGAADEVVVADVYLAREDPDPAVTGALVAEAVPLPADRVAFVPVLSDVPAALVERARPGDLVLTLGAGDVTELPPAVLALLESGEAR
ncbi:UDP-N-acetylmuramate--L-alanine ligase [Nocardioides coralli]|uniref:UDP-N-acetylmuramate--L-alanine ligase n=1 Tax=Nocardioides coralli TaxID=2872154 RepID=UPI001CA42FA3|nr:UDP-N-acetylmuramate--L-alanine ligase [Nocardioides coralli]QZY27958.1 UDP-N-acetylmuramate--L-alanine ligase [Nocardioides coralli]